MPRGTIYRTWAMGYSRARSILLVPRGTVYRTWAMGYSRARGFYG